MLARRSVLVVDSLEETQEVLRTALASHGVEVISARDSSHGWTLARQHQPELVVLDLECDARSASLAQRLVEDQPNGPPVVLLGKARQPQQARCSVVGKPYHYAALLRKIEGLLDGTTEPQSCLRCSYSGEITRACGSS